MATLDLSGRDLRKVRERIAGKAGTDTVRLSVDVVRALLDGYERASSEDAPRGALVPHHGTIEDDGRGRT